LKAARPLGGIMVIGYAIETLRDEAPLHATSTPGVEAVLAAGYRNNVGESNEGMACTPAVTGSKDPRLGLGKPHPFALNGYQVKGPPQAGRIEAPSYGRGCFTEGPVLWARFF
jgi:hypothetical protein